MALKTIDAITSGDGSFLASIRLEKAGSHMITASYAGSELYEPSTASAVVEARAPPAPPSSALTIGDSRGFYGTSSSAVVVDRGHS